MAKMVVERREIHTSFVEVEADTPLEALRKVEQDEGEEIDTEYHDTEDSDTWVVVNKEDNTSWMLDDDSDEKMKQV